MLQSSVGILKKALLLFPKSFNESMSSKHHHFKHIASNVRGRERSIERSRADYKDTRHTILKTHSDLLRSGTHRRLYDDQTNDRYNVNEQDYSYRNHRNESRRYNHNNVSRIPYNHHRDRSRSPIRPQKSSNFKDRYNVFDNKSRFMQDSTRNIHSSSRHAVENSSLKDKVRDIMQTEDHHIVRIVRDTHGEIDKVVWCPQYVRKNSSKQRAPGGKAMLHHRCRSCRRICLHLLGKYGSSDRKCLECSASKHGWNKHEVPTWYYHDKKCDHCN